jgi:hypothetical protein
MPLPRKFSGLTDPYLKTERAKEHLEALRENVKAFCESKPGTFTGKEDRERGEYRISIVLKEPPDKISLILGDFLYCLRSSLEQLNWRLCRLTPLGVTNSRKIQFPILDTPDEKKLLRLTCGMPTEARAIIEQLQPYSGGKANDMAAIRAHLLWRLDRLHTIDKHHRIAVVGSATDFKFPYLPRGAMSRIRFDNENGVIIAPIDLKSQMTLDPNVTFSVLFGDHAEGLECDFATIERIHDLVANCVIPRFARSFQ